MSGEPGMTVGQWFAIHDAYHKASDEYNKRLSIVRAERERGRWDAGGVSREYDDLSAARCAANQANTELYEALKKRSS